jgi:hypothetical protein
LSPRNSLLDIDPRTGRAIPELRAPPDPYSQNQYARLNQEVEKRQFQNALAAQMPTYGVELLAAAGGMGVRQPWVAPVRKNQAMFAGTNAQTANRNALRGAMALEAKGRSPRRSGTRQAGIAAATTIVGGSRSPTTQQKYARHTQK